MEQSKEAYVSFETAKLLKEKGFDWKTDHDLYYVVKGYGTGTQFNFIDYNPGSITHEPFRDYTIEMPTQQMAASWLRLTHKLHITCFSSSQESWMYRITKPHQKLEEGIYGEDYATYEDALEAAMLYCLKNLI